jgi:hypothetical protein
MPHSKVLEATLLMFMSDSLWYRTLLMDKTDMFSAFVVYLDQKMKSLDHFQKTFMHLEVRLGDCSHRCSAISSQVFSLLFVCQPLSQ